MFGILLRFTLTTSLTALIAQMSTVDKLNITQQSISQAPVGQADDVGYPGLFYADGSSGLRGWPLASSFDTAINGELFVLDQERPLTEL